MATYHKHVYTNASVQLRLIEDAWNTRSDVIIYVKK